MENTNTHHQNTHQVPAPQHHSHTTWVEIDAAAYEHNLMSYKRLAGNALFAPVVKSNAYGHGLEHMAKLCEQSMAVDMICTVHIAEALLLRSMGIKKPLLVLSILHGDLEQAVRHSIDLAVHDLAMAHRLSSIGTQMGLTVNIHVKVDTGLSRMGMALAHAIETIIAIHALPNITIQGISTHLAESENADQTFTNLQLERFTSVIQQLEKLGIHIPLKHSSCSAAISANDMCHFTMVRAGVGTYGLWPSADNKKNAADKHPGFLLKPVLTWKTTIVQTKEIPAGSFIGYNRTHQVATDTRLAVLPIGYWDGYDRKLSNKGLVLINGQRAPVVGRIAMNLTTVDITGIQAEVGDEVTLLGNRPGITAEDLAKHCRTINYEIVTRINPLLPRILV